MSERTRLLVSSLEGDRGALHVIDIADADVVGRSRFQLLAQPHALTEHPSRPFVYVACWNAAGGGEVQAFRTSQASSALDLHAVVSSGGDHPCSLVMDPSGRWLIVANYDGSLAVIAVAADGDLRSIPPTMTALTGSGARADRQEGSHPHAVLFEPSSGELIVADLGADRVHVLQFDSRTGRISGAREDQGRAAPGSGPRHVALTGEGHAVVTDELSATVSYFTREHRGFRHRKSVPAATKNETANFPGDVIIASAGHLAFTTNRGPDTISAFRIRADGLELLGEYQAGAWPLKLAIGGSTLYCASRDENAVMSWAVDLRTGQLRSGPLIQVDSPTWISASRW